MPLVNLIAAQREVRRAKERAARAWFFAFVGLSGLSLVGAGALTLQVESARSNVRSLQKKAEDLAPYQSKLEDLDKMIAAMKPKLDTLGKARLDTQRWLRILDHISLVVPPNTWLTSVKSQNPGDPKQPVQVQWTGMSQDQNLVGEFMLRLQQSTDLGGIELKFTDMKRTPAGMGLEFRIDCVVPGTEEMPEKSGSKKSSDTNKEAA